MSLIEAVTLACGMAYLGLLHIKANPAWSWRLSLGLLLAAWLVAADLTLWLGLGLVVALLAILHRFKPLSSL